MTLDLTVLKDALHSASAEEIKRSGKGMRAFDIAFGRGILVGLVAGLMANGKSFDEAWELLLVQAMDSPLHEDCIPPRWPSLKDYLKAYEDTIARKPIKAPVQDNPPIILDVRGVQWTPEDILRREG